jgi:hypothetical protein
VTFIVAAVSVIARFCCDLQKDVRMRLALCLLMPGFAAAQEDVRMPLATPWRTRSAACCAMRDAFVSLLLSQRTTHAAC